MVDTKILLGVALVGASAYFLTLPKSAEEESDGVGVGGSVGLLEPRQTVYNINVEASDSGYPTESSLSTSTDSRTSKKSSRVVKTSPTPFISDVAERTATQPTVTQVQGSPLIKLTSDPTKKETRIKYGAFAVGGQ